MIKKTSILKTKLFLFIGIAVIIIAAFLVFKSNNDSGLELITVKRGVISQEVSVIGKVKAIEKVDLSFERNGTISEVNSKIGDKINVGQSILKLDTSELLAKLKSAEAALEAERAKLNELKAGTRLEEIKVKESELKKAEQDLSNYYSDVIDVLNDAYAKADDSVRKQTDEFFSNDEESNPQLSFKTINSQFEIDAESGRQIASKELNNWKTELSDLSMINSSRTDFDQGLKNAKNYLNAILDFLNKTTKALIDQINLTQASFTAYWTSLNTARNTVVTALTNINNHEQLISAQIITVQKTDNELKLKLAGALPEQIAAQEAKVKQAEAEKLSIQTQIRKSVLKSPINGTVTKLDLKVGEVISSNIVLISVASEDGLKIEANVPEVDIVKVKIGNNAKVTLDAYGNDMVFKTAVADIEPAETIIEGVATYKVILQFIEKNEQIRSGMTANIDILTEKRENVLIIPQKVIVSQNGDKLVKVLDENNEQKEVKIKTGIRGSDGNVEIIEGLIEGDKIIVSSGLR
ncbi:MAG: efflux RND transporter periplasmic adaptor subunit [Patescibacteria group bacterium]|nr:efflux RND transporter periplasmic adaptor subunit [Patescibacteria group bacterium]